MTGEQAIQLWVFGFQETDLGERLVDKLKTMGFEIDAFYDAQSDNCGGSIITELTRPVCRPGPC